MDGDVIINSSKSNRIRYIAVVAIVIGVCSILFWKRGEFSIFHFNKEKGAFDYNKCMSEYSAKIKSSPLNMVVLKSAHDSILRWINSGLSDTKYLKEKKWNIDSLVFFNNTKDKCLILMTEISYDSNRKADQCMILGAELINQKWQLYYQSYPEVNYFRTKNNNRPYTKKEIVKYTQYELLKDGLFNQHTCEINSSYLNSKTWFSEDRRSMHTRFLKGEFNE